MKILAIDTATEACSAALYIDGDIEQQYELAPREHTQLVLGMADSLLQQAGLSIPQLDALAFGRGPGSFTGVRIATGVIQGMAYAADLPVVPVSTLASIAQSAYEDHGCDRVLSAIDARMGGVYWSEYVIRDGLAELLDEEMVTTPDQVPLVEGSWVGAGSGWKGHKDALLSRLAGHISQRYEDYFPQSASIARLAAQGYENGQAVEAAQAVPVYLRNDVAKKAKALL